MRFGRGADSTSNVQDRRTGGNPRAGGFGGGGGLPIPIPRGKGAAGLIATVLVVVVTLFIQSRGGGGGGTDITDLFPSGAAPSTLAEAGVGAQDEELAVFVAQVFNDAQDLWADTFSQEGRQYSEATLALFDTPTPSGCGGARAEVGPHYCPPDETVFIELGFMRELDQDFDAPGDFAQAYVVAHEMGHHVQNLLGTSDRARDGQTGAESQSVRLELQADCYAGIWAKTVEERGYLDAGDIDEALAAAAGVGDDRIQSKATGRIDPEGWTHGSAEQRQRWFRTGFGSGRPGDCDTFSGDI